MSACGTQERFERLPGNAVATVWTQPHGFEITGADVSPDRRRVDAELDGRLFHVQ